MTRKFETKVLILICLVLLSLPACSSRQVAQPGKADEFTVQLDKMMPGLLQRHRVPGVAIALVHDGEFVWAQGYGLADKANDIPVTPDTVFQVASISKPVSAWDMMRLVEAGKLDLDAPVERYLTRWHLPPSEFDHDGVTIRRLLSHSAGLSLHGYPGFDPGQPLPTVEESLSGVTRGAGDVRVVQEPGLKFSRLLDAEAYGFGYGVETLPSGARAVSHGGSNRGWRSQFAALPEKGEGIVILTNSDRGSELITDVMCAWGDWVGEGTLRRGRSFQMLRTAMFVLAAILGAGLVVRVWRLAAQIRSGRRRWGWKHAQIPAWRRTLDIVMPLLIIALWWLLVHPLLLGLSPTTSGWVTWAFTLWSLAGAAAGFAPKVPASREV